MTSATLERPRSTPTVTAPPRSLTQRHEALTRANAIRSHRAGLKRDLKAGRENVLDVLLGLEERPDRELLATMKIADLILAAPKFGRVKVNKVLVQARVSPSKTLAGMTARQRNEVITLTRR